MDNDINKSENSEQKLHDEKNNYKEAFEQDKPFFFIKIIQLRIRRLEEQIASLFKRK